MSNPPNFDDLVGGRLPVDYRKLTPRERRFVRERYIQKQSGRCRHCDRSLDDKPAPFIESLPVSRHLFPPGFFSHPVHLHHDHATGLTIGAVHARCNAVLWEYHNE